MLPKLSLSVLERKPGFIYFGMKHTPEYSKYKLSGYKTLAAALTGGNDGVIVTLDSNGTFVSDGLVVPRNFPFHRDYTDFLIAPDKHGGPAGFPPFDYEFGYYTINAFSVTKNDWIGNGVVTIVPPVEFYRFKSPILTLQVAVPNTNPVAGEEAPEGAVVVHLPSYLESFQVSNIGNNDVFLSFDWRAPMISLSAGKEVNLFHGATNLLLVGCNGATSTITLVASLSPRSY